MNYAHNRAYSDHTPAAFSGVPHADWAEEFMDRRPEFNADNAEDIIKFGIGQVFAQVLECAGVYKCTAEGRRALRRFLSAVNEE